MIDPRELRRRFPKASNDFLSANPPVAGASGGKDAADKRPVQDESLGKIEVQKVHTGRVFIRCVGVSKRLGDDEAAVPKYHIDMLRYAGIIGDDSQKFVSVLATERKAEKGEEEAVWIEVWAIPEDRPLDKERVAEFLEGTGPRI